MSRAFAETEEGKNFPLQSVVARWRMEVLTPVGEKSMTRQEFAAECDINNIMRGYENGRAWPGPAPGVEPVYFDFTSVPMDLQSALHYVQGAANEFMTLHANVRREFDNDPVKFVDFATNPANIDKMREWGLAAPPPRSSPGAAEPGGSPGGAPPPGGGAPGSTPPASS